MIFLIHSETSESNVASNIGRPEYSYFFVKQSFRPILERLGTVAEVTDPQSEVDDVWLGAMQHGEPCVFLSFAPPHRSPIGLQCPTIPVFAWEFDTIPNEIWNGDVREDWTAVLRDAGRAIVHSTHTVSAIRRQLGPGFPVTCIPAPVWDRHAPARDDRLACPAAIRQTTLILPPSTIDSAAFPLEGFERSVEENARVARAEMLLHRTEPVRVELGGVVYTSVLNPFDGRKHASAMIRHFIWIFRDCSDVTLLLKTTHWNVAGSAAFILLELAQCRPFACRIVIVNGFIPAVTYEAIIRATTYVVNCSVGEGQCLPLMEFMSCAVPAIAPINTAMADYVSGANAFIVKDTREPTIWPHDGRLVYRALRARIDFHSLMLAFEESYRVAVDAPARYAGMSRHAAATLARHCSDAVTTERLRRMMLEISPETWDAASSGPVRPRLMAVPGGVD